MKIFHLHIFFLLQDLEKRNNLERRQLAAMDEVKRDRLRKQNHLSFTWHAFLIIFPNYNAHIFQSQAFYLERAITNYVRCLVNGDKYDLCVFRLCSLWFENDSNVLINDIVSKAVDRIPTHKWLPLMYQLAAR